MSADQSQPIGAAITSELPPQIFGRVSVTVHRKSEGGDRYARLESIPTGRTLMRVPLRLLGLAAGGDAWMREIKFKCSECGAAHMAKEMECETCQKCFAEGSEENARLDRGEVSP